MRYAIGDLKKERERGRGREGEKKRYLATCFIHRSFSEGVRSLSLSHNDWKDLRDSPEEQDGVPNTRDDRQRSLKTTRQLAGKTARLHC